MSENPPTADLAGQIEQFTADYQRLTDEVHRVLVGHDQAVHEALTALLAGGHVLLEGVPGLGKTLLVRTLAAALDLTFQRIQFTPDLMPADITGTQVVVADPAGGKRFEFQPGPVFANLVLADEINRATPKTQSALLEAMQERTVSAARTTHALPQPFLVLATQNPIEMEGTYPLPEAQLDRFLLKVLLGFSGEQELVEILTRTTGADVPQAGQVLDDQRIGAMQQTVRQVAAAPQVARYAARLVLSAHPEGPNACELARRAVRYGPSPRGAQALLLGAKVLALRDGRANVAYDDIRQMAPAALRHRLVLSFEAQADGVTADQVLQQAIDRTPSSADG